MAWSRNEVGIWYGAWSAMELDAVAKMPNSEVATRLSNVPAQRSLGWEVPVSYVYTARRFTDIGFNDWVVVFFESSLHMARMCSDVKSDAHHTLNRGGELFKFRNIVHQKSFRLNRLPDSYRLIPSAGRGNIHQYNGTNWYLVHMLAESKGEKEVSSKLSAMTIQERLDLLGPEGWESFCLGYLIIEEDFLPSGLCVGRTLNTLDIVGHDWNGTQILAQCKKSSGPMDIPPDFLEACSDVRGRAKLYYFAYGGCLNTPDWIRVFSLEDVKKWGQTEKGSKYLAMFFS